MISLITKEKLEDIIDNVKTDIQVDIESNGDMPTWEIETIKNSANMFYRLLKDKINDYFEFESECE